MPVHSCNKMQLHLRSMDNEDKAQVHLNPRRDNGVLGSPLEISTFPKLNKKKNFNYYISMGSQRDKEARAAARISENQKQKEQR